MTTHFWVSDRPVVTWLISLEQFQEKYMSVGERSLSTVDHSTSLKLFSKHSFTTLLETQLCALRGPPAEAASHSCGCFGSPGVIPDWGFLQELPNVPRFCTVTTAMVYMRVWKSLLYSSLLFPCLWNGANNSISSCLEISMRACVKSLHFVIAIWGPYIGPTTLSPVVRRMTKIWQWPSLLLTVTNSCSSLCILPPPLLESILSLVERICSF